MTGYQPRAIAASAIGQAHVASGLPNQDAAVAEIVDSRTGDGATIALAVADGHGSASHPRSAVGSTMAIEAFVREAPGAIALLRGAREDEAAALRATIFGQVLQLWRDKITAHAAADPPRANVDLPTLYGTTLIAAVLWPGGGALWQVGDGDAVVELADGALTRLLPADDLPGEETASLCLPDAQQWLRSATIPPARAVALFTDGFGKSFGNDALRFQAVEQLLAGCRAGQDPAGLRLALSEQARSGSRDDTSAAIGMVDAPMARPVASGHANPRRWLVGLVLAIGLLVVATIVWSQHHHATSHPAAASPGGTAGTPRVTPSIGPGGGKSAGARPVADPPTAPSYPADKGAKP